MQKLPVYLYTNRYSVILDLDNNRGVNNVMYQRNLIFQKGLKNKVQIQFKNSDQKPVDVSSGTFYFKMFTDDNIMPFQPKQLTVIDDGVTTSTRGLAVLTLSESDTLDVPAQNFNFSITSLDSEGNYNPTYANTYYGVSGTAEIRDDAEPYLTPSVETTTFEPYRDSPKDRTGVVQYNWWSFHSVNLGANPAFNTNIGLQTISYYLTNFKGRVEIYATLQNDPSGIGNANEQFALLMSIPYATNTTGVKYTNISGNYTYFKVKYIPDADNTGINWYGSAAGNNPTPGVPFWPNGKVDKIQFRS
jgi:hypothetical protein